MPNQAINGISVVVCTHNRLDLLKRCLESLLNQRYENFEIIVVNDASSDATREYLVALNQPNLTAIHHEKNLGLSPSRNDGIKQAKFNLIAFTDDDCEADQNWLLEIEKAFRFQNVDFGAGQTFLVAQDYRGYFPERIVTNLAAVWPKGNNLIFKKHVFEKIGLFDPGMDYYSNDDSEIAIRAISAGFKFLRIPTALVYHQKTFWIPQSLLKSARNPSVWVLLKKKYPGHYLFFDPPVKLGTIIDGMDYLFIFTMPVLLPVLFLRFIFNHQKHFKLFFIKWPLYPFLRRFYIYKAAIRQRVFMI